MTSTRAPTASGRATRRPRHRHRRAGASAPSCVVDRARAASGHPRRSRARPRRRPRHAGRARSRPQRRAPLRRRRAETARTRARRRSLVFIESVRLAAPDDDLRRRRLHRGAARVAKVLGYHVTVCDAREVFATRHGSPWPTRSSSPWPTSSSMPRGDARASRRHLRTDPRPQVRHPRGTRRADDQRRLHRRHRQPHDAAKGGAAARGGRRAKRPQPSDGTDRSRHRRAHPEETAISIGAEIIATQDRQDRPQPQGLRRPHPRLSVVAGSANCLQKRPDSGRICKEFAETARSRPPAELSLRGRRSGRTSGRRRARRRSTGSTRGRSPGRRRGRASRGRGTGRCRRPPRRTRSPCGRR